MFFVENERVLNAGMSNDQFSDLVTEDIRNDRNFGSSYQRGKKFTGAIV
jgi:hypothetical protein